MKYTQAVWDEEGLTGRWTQFDAFTQEQAYEFHVFTQHLIGVGIETFEIHLSNGGGAMFPTLSMVDDVRLLKRAGVDITTYASGLCASASAVLWSYGDTRIIGAHAWLMFHSLAITSEKGSATVHDLEAQATHLRRVQNRINTELADQLGLSAETIAEIMSTDTWITAEEALSLGIATDIL